MKRTVSTAALLVLCLVAPGCYAHVPVSPQEVSPGADVRVRVSATEAERLEQEARITERVFRAQVVENGPSNLLLQVPIPANERFGGRLYNRVSLAPQEVVELEIREVDRARTALAIGAGAAVVAAAVALAFEATDDGEGSEKEPGTPNRGILSFPLLGWAFR